MSRSMNDCKVLVEGKTKILTTYPSNEQLTIVYSKDDITAGDGKKHDILTGKGQLANQTTCSVFEYLKTCGVPLAYISQHGHNSFIAKRCKMLPYEVVERRVALGSYLERNPDVGAGEVFDDIIVEFFLKTTGGMWRGRNLDLNDPYIVHDERTKCILVYHAHRPPKIPRTSINVRNDTMLQDDWRHFANMRKIARQVFLHLEEAWKSIGCMLIDMKIEFGIDVDGNLVVADVIDNDSWRVFRDGKHLDKQLYRGDSPLADVLASYKEVARLTNKFRSL